MASANEEDRTRQSRWQEEKERYVLQIFLCRSGITPGDLDDEFKAAVVELVGETEVLSLFLMFLISSFPIHQAFIEGLSLGAVPPGLPKDDINLNESSQNPSLFGYFFRLLSLVVIELDLPWDSKQAEVCGESFLAWNETIFKEAVAAILT